MDGCAHGMDAGWCFLCRIENSGVNPRAAWGLDQLDEDPAIERSRAPMTRSQESYLRFLCAEFGDAFDGTLTEGETAMVIETFLDEPATPSQSETLSWLAQHAGADVEDGLTYGQARTKIRRLVALRGLRSA